MQVLYCWELGAGMGHVARMNLISRDAAWGAARFHYVLRNPAAAEILELAGTDNVSQAPIADNGEGGRTSPSFSHILWRSGWWDAEIASRLLRAWQNLMRQVEADFVICDHAPTAAVAAQSLSLPWCHVGNGFEIPPADSPLPPLEPWRQLDKRTLKKWDRQVGKNLRLGQAMVGAKNPISSVQALFSGPNRLVTVHPLLDHYMERPHATCFQSLASRVSGGAPPAAASLPSQLPKLFVYLAAATPNLLELLRQCARRFLVFGYIRELPRPERAMLQSQGIEIADRPLDMDRALSLADAALCHGGVGTVYNVLASGTPLFVLPSQAEQALLAHGLSRRQLAVPIGHARDTRGAVEGLIRGFAARKALPSLADYKGDQTGNRRLLEIPAAQFVREHAACL